MKTCTKCHKDLPLSQFYRRRRDSDKRQGACKKCHDAVTRRNYFDNHSYYREYARRRYQKDAEYRESLVEAQRRHRTRHPEKNRAHAAVLYAIQRGKIVRPSECSECGATCTPEAHHEDYAKPLEVEWLCFTCHRRRHGQLTDI